MRLIKPSELCFGVPIGLLGNVNVGATDARNVYSLTSQRPESFNNVRAFTG
jgi:hypothetical protein